LSLKVAIVGCGKIADGHLGEIQKMDDAHVVSVCDLEKLMAEQLAVRFNVPSYYDDLSVMLESENPDVVHLTTPPQSHLKLAKQAIDAGCHVYVEKPFTMDTKEAKELVAYAVAAGKKVTVGHSFHFDPAALAMRRLVDDGVLGDTVHVESYFGYNLSGPFGAAILADGSHWVHGLPGKLFHNNIDHMLNKILEFIPDPQPAIDAFAFTRRDESFGDVRDELYDELRLVVRGERTTGYGTFTSHVSPVAHFARVYGTKAIIHVDYITRSVTVERGARLPSAIGRLVPAFGSGWAHNKEGLKNVFRFARSDYHFFAGMNYLITAFYRSIVDDTDPPIAYDEIIRTTSLMDEIFAQIADGSTVQR